MAAPTPRPRAACSSRTPAPPAGRRRAASEARTAGGPRPALHPTASAPLASAGRPLAARRRAAAGFGFLHPVPAVLLRPVQGGISSSEEVRARKPVVGVGGGADRDGHGDGRV